MLDVHLQKRVCQAFVKQLEATAATRIPRCSLNPSGHLCCGQDQSIDVQGNAVPGHHFLSWLHQISMSLSLNPVQGEVPGQDSVQVPGAANRRGTCRHSHVNLVLFLSNLQLPAGAGET